MAEDYAPFDVDVTTEAAGRAASRATVLGRQSTARACSSAPYRATSATTAASPTWASTCDTSDCYKPALVFPEKLGQQREVHRARPPRTSAGTLSASVTTAVTDGTTRTTPGKATAKRAGRPSWASATTRTSRSGAGASTPTLTLRKTTWPSSSYGLRYRADDYGNTLAAAATLPAGTTLAVGGVIALATDIDVFSFTAAAGPASMSVRPAERGPNLDIQIDVVTTDGNILRQRDPTDTLGADISLTLGTAGAYYLRVQGVGKGDPLTTGYTDYASLGQYAITGTVVDPGTTPRPPVAVASATPTTGAAPLAVSFTAAGSFDLDGSIVAYAWDFGDGGSAAGAAVSAYLLGRRLLHRNAHGHR